MKYVSPRRDTELVSHTGPVILDGHLLLPIQERLVSGRLHAQRLLSTVQLFGLQAAVRRSQNIGAVTLTV